MVRERAPIDISTLPELDQLVDEVQRSRSPRVLRRNNEDAAILSPVPAARKRRRVTRPVTHDDPLFGLIGIGRSGIAGGVSERKHEQLDRALRHE